MLLFEGGIKYGGYSVFNNMVVDVVWLASGAEGACQFGVKLRILIEESGAILNKVLRIGYKRIEHL